MKYFVQKLKNHGFLIILMSKSITLIQNQKRIYLLKSLQELVPIVVFLIIVKIHKFVLKLQLLIYILQIKRFQILKKFMLMHIES